MFKFLNDLVSPDYIHKVKRGEAVSAWNVLRNPRYAFEQCQIPSTYLDIMNFNYEAKRIIKEGFPDSSFSKYSESETKMIKSINRYRNCILKLCQAYISCQKFIENAHSPYLEIYDQYHAVLTFPWRSGYMMQILGPNKFVDLAASNKAFAGFKRCRIMYPLPLVFYVIVHLLILAKLKIIYIVLASQFNELIDCPQYKHEIQTEEDSADLGIKTYKEMIANPTVRGNLSRIPTCVYDISTDEWLCPMNLRFLYFDAVYDECKKENLKFKEMNMIELFTDHFGKPKIYFYNAIKKKKDAKKFHKGNADYDAFIKAFPDYIFYK